MQKEHIEESLNKIRGIFEQASERIETLGPGEKIPATVLAAELAEQHNMTGPQLYPVLLFLFKGYPGVEIRKGAHGGIYRPKVDNKPTKVSDSVSE